MSEVAIRVKNLSKVFKIPHEKHSSLKQAALNVFSRKTYQEFETLKDISFEVKKGEFFGIIGRNGSGKSTLLKILAGIYVPGSGQVHIDGKLSPFLELGVGFNPDLTARENVFLGGSILGLTRKEVAEKLDRIIRFAELEDFMDMKLKNFSSGMHVRLAFSLAINAHAEILLMDEVLAVGDSNFQGKCLEEFNKHREQGKTVVLVTHDISVVQRYCDRAMLLRNGNIEKIGEPFDVISRYTSQNISDEARRLVDEVPKEGEKVEEENKKISIKNVEFLNVDGRAQTVFQTGDDIVIRLHYVANKVIAKPVFGLAIYTQDNIHITGPNTRTSNFVINEVVGDGYVDYIIKENPFFTGSFYLTVAVYNWECAVPYDFLEKKFVFKIKSSETNQFGIVKLNEEWRTEQAKEQKSKQAD